MVDGRPTFSVILPTYNGSEFIADALDSVEEQTFTDFELIVSDDASTDETHTVVEEHAVMPDIFLKHDENLGIARNTNSAVTRASGEYLAFIDQDDRWLPEKLESHVETHDQTTAAMVYSDYRRISFEGDSIETWRCPDAAPSGEKLIKQLLTEHNFVRTLSGVTLQRDVWEQFAGFDNTLRLAADYDLWFRIARNHNFEHKSDILVEKRTHGHNVSSNRDLNYKEVLYILHKLSLKHPHLAESIQQKRRKTHFTRAWETYLSNNPRTALACSLRSLRDHTLLVHNDTGTKPHGLLVLAALDELTGPLNVGRQLLNLKQFTN